MSFTNSSTLKIPLADPVVKYGNGYRVANIYLTSSSEPQTSYNLESSYKNPSIYQQDFQTKYLNLSWSVISPSNGYIYTQGEEIEKSPFISGFNINIYKNSGNLTGVSTVNNRTKVFSASGVFGNSFLYEISGEEGHRNYSAEVILVDFTGNRSSGLLTSRNPEPSFTLLETGASQGVFISTYSGNTGTNGVDTSNGFQGLNLYNVTGLGSGESGFFIEGSGFEGSYARRSRGSEGVGAIELSPGVDNYVAAIGRDQYGTGSIQGFFNAESGQSGFLNIPWKIDYPIEIVPITGYRVFGGDGLYYSFKSNYNTGSALLETCYGITGTGKITGAVSGYTGEMFLDSGILFDTSYNKYNTGDLYIYDNSIALQSGLHTGALVEVETTGIGFTGTGTIGSGAGNLWAPSFPKYSGVINGESGGLYSYGYYDPVAKGFSCTSEREVTGGFISMGGAYSMPKDNPNSFDIKYREGINYSKSYEQAAAFLNAQGEMPAVIINPSQQGWLSYGILWGLNSALFSALLNIFLRKLLYTDYI